MNNFSSKGAAAMHADKLDKLQEKIELLISAVAHSTIEPESISWAQVKDLSIIEDLISSVIEKWVNV